MGLRSITDGGRPLTAADIEALERRLDASLPEPYRAFLLRHNGGRPLPAKYGERTLENFLSVDGVPEGYADIWHAIENLRDDLPEDVIPIGWDVSNDAIVLALAGDNRGRIYLWNSDGQAPAVDYNKLLPGLTVEIEYIPDDWPGHPDLVLYAEDFDEFLASFHEPEDE